MAVSPISIENLSKKGARRAGRKPGGQNKITRALKDMILGALDDCGGQAYLARQAEANPAAFLALIGKILPTQLTGDGGRAIAIQTIELVALTPASDESEG